MSLSQTVAELGLIIKGVLYLSLRPFGASSIQGRLIIAEIRYVFEQNKYNSSPILEFSVKFASQICHENSNNPLEGDY